MAEFEIELDEGTKREVAQKLIDELYYSTLVKAGLGKLCSECGSYFPTASDIEAKNDTCLTCRVKLDDRKLDEEFYEDASKWTLVGVTHENALLTKMRFVDSDGTFVVVDMPYGDVIRK